MTKRWRRFEVLLPHQFNDGRAVPERLLGRAVREIFDRFGAASSETQKIKGFRRHRGRTYHEDYARVFVDVADTAENRAWFREFKKRWKERLEQIELWVISYRIEID
jgi:hypothetical protein